MQKLLVCFLFLVSIHATTFTVKAGGGGDFTTIQACATAMANGDTCTVFAGTYAEHVTLTAGGVASYKTLQVNGTDTVNVLDFTINSHDKIVGFHIQNPSSPSSSNCISIVNASTDIYITNNNLYACGSNAMIAGVSSNDTGTFVYIQGNTFSYPCSTSSAPNVCAAVALNGGHRLIENNDISHVSDALLIYGDHDVLRKNTLHDVTDTDCGTNSGNCHVDFQQADSNVTGGGQASQYRLIESNIVHDMAVTGSFAGASMHAGGIFQAENCNGLCFNAIARFNLAYHIHDSGFGVDNSFATPPPQAWINVKEYNNSWVDMLTSNQADAIINVFSHGSFGGSNFNDLYTFGQATRTNPYACLDTACSPYNYGNNLAFCTGTPCTLFGHTYGSGAFTSDPGNIQADPLFANYAGNDFRLASGSPALNAGTYLTTVAAGDSGSGTALVVNDAAYFQDGLGLNAAGVNADCISVTTTTNHVCVTAVNYSTNTLTLAGSISRSNGDHIWLYSNSSGSIVLHGSAPNIGATTGPQITIASDPSSSGWTCAGGGLNCSITERQHGFEVFALHINIGGTGTITIGTITGSGSAATLTKLCTVGSTPCVPTTIAPADLWIYYDGYTDDGFNPASSPFLSAIPISGSTGGSGTVNLSLTLTAYTPPNITSLGGAFTNCASSGGVFPGLDLCTTAGLRPGGTFNFAAPGSSIIDSSFGSTVFTVAKSTLGGPIQTTTYDAVVTNYNSDKSLLITETSNGQVSIRSAVPPFTVLWANPPGISTGGSSRWSSLDPKTIYYTSSPTIHKAVLGAPGVVLSDIVIYTDTDGGAVLTDGGDSELAKDDWWVTADTANKKAIFLNLNCATLNCVSAFKYDYSGVADFVYRNSNISFGVDATSHLRYGILQSLGKAGNILLGFDGATVTNLGLMPQKPGLQSVTNVFTAGTSCSAPIVAAGSPGNSLCLDTVHGSVVEIAGVEYFITAQYGRQHPAYNNLTLMRFNAGIDKMTIDQADGGGLSMLWLFTQTVDTHLGAARAAPVAVLSFDQSVPINPAWRITNAVTSGANINLTVTTTAINGGSNPLTLVTTNNGQVSNVAGCANANGTWNNVTVSGTTITLPSVNCEGAYTSATGVVTQNVNPPSGHYYYEDIVFNMPSASVPAMTALRLEHARSICFSDSYIDNAPNPYYCQQHSSISQHGESVFFESNNGQPDTTSLFMVNTTLNTVHLTTQLQGVGTFRGVGTIQ